MQELVLTAVRWAGRATIEATREESLLLFAIALECLVLPTRGAELTHRLSQRVAWILSGDPDQRRGLTKRVRELYEVRSRVVHDGHYEVTEFERNGIRAVAKEVIDRLLLDPIVEQCAGTKGSSDNN